MSKYLVLYKTSGVQQQEPCEPSPEQQQAMMQAWMTWKEDAGDAIVDFGAPTMPVSGGEVGGYSIVRADSADGLDAVFVTNPHRQQGGVLEFHEIIEMPVG